MLPGTDGIELMRSQPALGELPMIFLSVYGRDETIARALEIGAANNVVKPFSPTELVARIRAALRRARAPGPYRAGELAIDCEERRVALAGRPVQTMATEYDLLGELSANAGRVLTHDDLLRRVWRSRDKSDVGLDAGTTLHGFRDLATENTDAPGEILEQCLAHVVGRRARQAYARSNQLEKRRAVMDEWSDYLADS